MKYPIIIIEVFITNNIHYKYVLIKMIVLIKPIFFTKKPNKPQKTNKSAYSTYNIGYQKIHLKCIKNINHIM